MCSTLYCQNFYSAPHDRNEKPPTTVFQKFITQGCKDVLPVFKKSFYELFLALKLFAQYLGDSKTQLRAEERIFINSLSWFSCKNAIFFTYAMKTYKNREIWEKINNTNLFFLILDVTLNSVGSSL